jgi:hypothetical protein
VLAGDGPTWVEDAYVPLHRHGFLEEAYFTFSYSPVRGMDGTIEGVLDIATETTRHVIDHRRLETLNQLREALGDVERVSQITERTLPLLRQNTADLPAVQLRYEEAAALRGGAGADATGPASAIVESGAGGRRVRLPLGAAEDEGRRPMLIVQLSEHLAPDSSYIGFLRLIAASIGQALARVHAGEAEHGIAEAMQRSLLTRPSQPEDLQVAVRYQPAAEQLQVGGDWYDSFIGPDGSTTLVVGDVTGHDQWAAAAMAQVRNLLRGVAYTLSQSPARELAVLDAAMYGLGVGVYATALLARVDRDPDDLEGTTRRLRWSNAGHPPPVLLGRDGRARLLETPPDVLLGLGDAPRHDHGVALAPGDTVGL